MVLSLVCSFALALTSQPRQAVGEFKGTAYVLPAKWTKQETDGVLLLSPPTSQAGEFVVVMIIPAMKSETKKGAKGRFLDFLAGADSKVNVISKGEIAAVSREGFNVFLRAEQLKDKEIGEYSCLYQMVTDDEHDALVGVLSKGDKLIELYQGALSDILASVRPAASSPVRARIRTGNTPDLYSGMPGWLPSGKGQIIPAAKLVDGKPIGMWFEGSMDSTSLTQVQLKLTTTIFLADGTMIRYPRFGSGGRVDISGQQLKPGDAKNVGTWSVSGGKMNYDVGGFRYADTFTTGKDSGGVYFKLNEKRFQPCEPVTEAFLSGRWTKSGSEARTFGRNGALRIDGSADPLAYALDGYLIAIDDGNNYIVDSIFKLTNDAIVIGSSVYNRVK